MTNNSVKSVYGESVAYWRICSEKHFELLGFNPYVSDTLLYIDASRVKSEQGDITDTIFMTRVCDGITAVIHCAARINFSPVGEVESTWKSNYTVCSCAT